MAWTYTGAPGTSPTDEIHFLVGDTDTTEQLVKDEEIAYFLTLYPKPAGKPAYLAAAAAADAIAAQFSRRAQRSIGSLSIAAQQQWEHYIALAQTMRTLYATAGLGIIPSAALRVVAASPVLGGGGTTVLGGPNNLRSGGTGLGGQTS